MEVNTAKAKAKKGSTGRIWWQRLMKYQGSFHDEQTGSLTLEALVSRHRKDQQRSIEEQRRYTEMVEACKAIAQQEKTDYIRRRHELGKQIKEKMGYASSDLARDLLEQVYELDACVMFAEKYPDIDAALAEFSAKLGSNLSWYTVKHFLYQSEAQKG